MDKVTTTDKMLYFIREHGFSAYSTGKGFIRAYMPYVNPDRKEDGKWESIRTSWADVKAWLGY